MVVGDFDQGGEIARLSLSVYLELMTILGAYREALVLVGGWAPYFIHQLAAIHHLPYFCPLVKRV